MPSIGHWVIGLAVAGVVGWVTGHLRDKSRSRFPPRSPAALEFHVRRLLLQQRKLEAIKLYQEFHKVDVLHATEIVEAMERGLMLPLPAKLEAEIRSLLVQQRKLEAIKLYRESENVDLLHAKEVVDAMERGLMLPPG